MSVQDLIYKSAFILLVVNILSSSYNFIALLIHARALLVMIFNDGSVTVTVQIRWTT